MPDHRLFEYMGHWLVRRSDTPNYHIYWLQGSRRVRRKSARTGDLELAKERRIALAKRRATPPDQEPESVMALDALSSYIEKTMPGRPGEPNARLAMRYFMAFFEAEGVATVKELTLDVQDRYIAWRRATGKGCRAPTLSNGTIARELMVLRAALNDHRKRGFLTRAPYIRSLPAPPPRQRFLTAEESRRLLAECKTPHLHLYVLLALHTLQRPRAIYELTTGQVDLGRGRIDFLPPDALQTNKRRPVVPITATLRPHLERAVASSTTGSVLEYHGEPVASVKKAFKAACRRAGLEDVTQYTLRHTGATLLAAAGVPMRQIAGMMGHTTQRITELYAKHSPDFLQDAARALDRIFPASGPQPPPPPPDARAEIIRLDIPRETVARIPDATLDSSTINRKRPA